MLITQILEYSRINTIHGSLISIMGKSIFFVFGTLSIYDVMMKNAYVSRYLLFKIGKELTIVVALRWTDFLIKIVYTVPVLIFL